MQHSRETIKSHTAEIERLTALSNDLAKLVTSSNSKPTPAISKLAANLTSTITYMKAPVLWNFNFIGTGWNTIGAVTKEEAIEKANVRYDDSDNLKPDPETFRFAINKDSLNQYSKFY